MPSSGRLLEDQAGSNGFRWWNARSPRAPTGARERHRESASRTMASTEVAASKAWSGIQRERFSACMGFWSSGSAQVSKSTAGDSRMAGASYQAVRDRRHGKADGLYSTGDILALAETRCGAGTGRARRFKMPPTDPLVPSPA